MKIRMIFAALAATLLAAGCFQDVHEIDPSGKVGYVFPELHWANPDDAGTDIHDLLVVVSSQGGAFTKHYSNVRDFAREPLAVPVGEADILVIANATEADGYQLSGLPPTKSSGMAQVLASLRQPVSSLHQAWFGPVTLGVEDGVVNEVNVSLERLLATITIEFLNVPAGSVLSFTISGVASSVILNDKKPAGESNNYVLGTLTGNGRQTFYCFPTISGQTRVILSVEVTPPGEPPYTCVCEVPALACGKEYTLQLDYNKLSTYMYVTSHTINEWAEGWTVSGEILNPQA